MACAPCFPRPWRAGSAITTSASHGSQCSICDWMIVAAQSSRFVIASRQACGFDSTSTSSSKRSANTFENRPTPPYASTRVPPGSSSRPFRRRRTTSTMSSAASADDWKNDPIDTLNLWPSTSSCTTPRAPREIGASISRTIWPSWHHTPRSPVRGDTRIVTSPAPSSTGLAMISLTIGWATMQEATPTISFDSPLRNPSVPFWSATMRTVVRRAAASSVRRRGVISSLPVRAKASVTMSTFVRDCADGSMCCQSQPPQPSATCGHGGSRRSGDASTTSSTTPRPKSLAFVSREISTVSPGSTSGTKTTLPSSSLVRPSPPATSLSILTMWPSFTAPA